MTIVSFTAKVKASRLLELPEEAQGLGLNPGDEVIIRFEQPGLDVAPIFPPNDGMLTVLHELTMRQQNRSVTDGADTLRLLQEAREGAMYGDDTVEQPASSCGT